MKLGITKVEVLTAGQAVAVGISAMLPMYLGRVLSVDEFASFRLVTFLLGMLSIVGSFGFDTAMYAIVGRDITRARPFSFNSLTWGAALGLALTIVCVLTRPVWPENIRMLLTSQLLTPFVMCLIGMMMAAHVEHLLVVVGRAGWSALIAAINALGMAAVCWACVNLQSSAYSAIWAMALWHCFRAAILLAFHVFTRAGSAADLGWREQLRMGAAGGTSNLLMGLQRLDRLVVAARFSAHDFALYSVGSFEIPLARNFCEAQHQVATVDILSQRRGTDLGLWFSYIRRSLIVLIPVIGLSMLFATPIVRLLFGPNYGDAGLYFAIAGLSTIVFALDPELLMRSGEHGKALVMIQVLSVGIFLICLTIPGLSPLQVLASRIATEILATASKYFVLFRSHGKQQTFFRRAARTYS